MSFMRDIMKHHSGTHSGTPQMDEKSDKMDVFLRGGEIFRVFDNYV